MPMVAQQAEMEDILSSIRTTLAEETAKVGGGSADLIDAAAADDDVLELTSAEMLDVSGHAQVAPPASAEDLIDIAAFTQTGETKPADPAALANPAEDLLGEPVSASGVAAAPEPVVAAAEAGAISAPAPAAAPAADEFDRLLAEISQEQKQQVSVAEEQRQALLAEEEPLGVEEHAEQIAAADPVVEPVVTAAEESLATAAAATTALPLTAESLTAAALPGLQQHYRLGTVESSDGVQIALPAEILAMALRPMVQQWLNDNLSTVVERLVKDEISKLTQN